jgi:hypothetical protein
MRRSDDLERQADLLLASEGVLANEPDPVLDRAVPVGSKVASLSDMFRLGRRLISPRHDECGDPGEFTQGDLQRDAEVIQQAWVERRADERRRELQLETSLAAATRRAEASIRVRLGSRRVNHRDGRKCSLPQLRGESNYQLGLA